MKWSDNDLRRLRKAHADKVSAAIIADMLGRSELSVLMKLQAMGLKSTAWERMP